MLSTDTKQQGAIHGSELTNDRQGMDGRSDGGCGCMRLPRMTLKSRNDQKKILKQELPLNKIREIDIYLYHPQYLAERQSNRDGEREWYFFTPRERKYLHGSRPNRTQRSGNGFWKVTGKDEVITSATGERIGFKNTLDYFEGTHSENQKTKWKMHEYRLKKSERDEEIAPSNNEKAQRDMKLVMGGAAPDLDKDYGYVCLQFLGAATARGGRRCDKR
ncbi:hypothetical protein ACLB2K_066186 [Fragaria x ananassa]